MSTSDLAEKNIHPLWIAMSLFAVLLLLLGLTFLSDEQVIKKTNTSEDGFVFYDFSLKYPTTATFFKKETDTLATEETVNQVTQAVIPIEEPVDSIVKEDSIKPKKTIDLAKIDSTKIFRILYPDTTGNFLKTFKSKLSSG